MVGLAENTDTKSTKQVYMYTNDKQVIHVFNDLYVELLNYNLAMSL